VQSRSARRYTTSRIRKGTTVAARGSVLITKVFPFVCVLLTVLSPAPLRAADNPSEVFRREWQGRRVTVQRMLLTLVYEERGRTGSTRVKREGLTVVTPSKGSYLMFTGRQSVDDLVESNPDRLFEQIKVNYRRDRNLGEGFVQAVNPLHLVQYISGLQLVVARVELERATVRVMFAKPDAKPESPADMATSLTIQWPAPFSSNLEERAEIERVIHQFVLPAPAARP
jgi:hypothetical protein